MTDKERLSVYLEAAVFEWVKQEAAKSFLKNSTFIHQLICKQMAESKKRK